MKDGPNARIHAVRVALQELGDATPEMVSAFVAQRFSLEIAPSVVPLIRAIIEDRERLETDMILAALPEEVVPAPVAWLCTDPRCMLR